MPTAPSIRGVVGYTRLPSKAAATPIGPYAKSYTVQTRKSMADIIARYSKVVDKLKGVTPQAIEEALQPVFDLSQVYCPVDTGALKASGELHTEPIGKSGKYRGEITYGGGGSIPYAAIVHERVDFYHEPPTRAKFLQSAMEEEFDNFLVTLATFYIKAFRQ